MNCSALAVKSRRGDVLIGRNLDLTIFQLPCYITHLKFGKYDTINFTYDELNKDTPRYGDLLLSGKINEDFYNALPMLATDSMNSEGLYLEYNMRECESQFICTGTNPEAKIRVCSISLPFLVTSNCASVGEALQYMREKLDIYTLADKTAASGWNLCFVIGDARGSYGLIEIANDEIRYLPYQHGQGNYYIYPEFNVTSRNQSGYGRLQFGLERIDRVQSEADMAILMEKIMWRNEILDIPYACRDNMGHIRFFADAEHKIPSLDWRSDNVKKNRSIKTGNTWILMAVIPNRLRSESIKCALTVFLRDIGRIITAAAMKTILNIWADVILTGFMTTKTLRICSAG